LDLAKRYMALYSFDGKTLGDEEFAYMVFREVGSYSIRIKCQNCLKATRESIEDFF